MLNIFRSILVLLAVIAQTAHADFIHPGITNTRSDLDRIKSMVEAQVDPWYASYLEMEADSKSSYNYTVRGDPSFTELGRDDGTNYSAWNSDIRAAYYNAIRWYVTGDERHAEKAVEIFNAWNNLEDVTSGGTRALSGAIVYIMLEAAEIIKSTYDGWPESEIQEFKDMLVYPGYSNTAEPDGISRTSGSFYWQAYQGDSVRHGNQGLAGFRAVMAMGIFLDNEIIYDRALRYIQGMPHRPDDLAYPPGPHTATTISSVGTYADTYNYTQSTTVEDFGFNELITNYIWITGQCQESSRDQSHSNFGIGILCAMSEMAWNQGYDLYSHADDRLLLGLEFTTKYNVTNLQSYPDQTTWWIPTVASGEFMEGFNASQRVYSKAISPINVGGFPGSQPIFEIPVGHYIGRGIKTAEEVKWTVRARDYALATTGYEDAGHVNGAVGWGALTERRVELCYGDPINGFSGDLPVFEMSVLPGTIEAEHYDYSPVDGEGRTYHDTTTTNSGGAYRVSDGVDISVCSEGGYQLTEIEVGEWVSYTVSVEDAGMYQLAVRYAAAEDVAIRVEFAGSDLTGDVTLPSTGGATNWASYLVGNDLLLSKGVQSMRVHFPDAAASYSLNSITIWSDAAQESRIEAEAYDAFLGVQTQETSDVGGGLNLGYIDDGDWCRYDNISLDGATTFKVRVARNSGRSDGRIEVRLDSLTGALIGSVDVPETGGWDVWETIETNLTGTTGMHSIYLVFTNIGSGSGRALFDVNWFELDIDGQGPTQILPYAESFESGFGAWTQSADDDFDWSIGSGETTTTSTGPSAAPDSSQYLYLEAHDSSEQYKMAQLSCVFDLSPVASAELVFDYHMCGEDIDYLAVDVYDGTVWTPNVWIRDGQQHSSSEEAWMRAEVDLSDYVGNSAVTLRFRGKQTQWHLADMAIDNIRVTEIPASLVAHWPMDESSGTLVPDRSSGGFDGTATDASWVTGVNGNALSFNGGSSRVSIPAATFASISDEVTISMWVNGGATQPKEDSVFYAVDSSGTRILNIHLPWSNSAVYWDVGNSTGYDRIFKIATADQFMDEWNHWAFTKNATTGVMNIYVNGELFQTGSSKTRSIIGINQAFIGGQPSAAEYDGIVDDVQLYNIELTATEVMSLYHRVVNPAVLSPAGSGSGYDVTSVEAAAFRSNGIVKMFDADGDNAYGSAGTFFYGNGADNTNNTDGKPSWVTTVSSSVASLVASAYYTDFDNPTLAIFDTVADWTTTSIANVDTAGTTGGLWAELMTFTVDTTAPREFRLGVMAGNENTPDGRWDPAAVRLSFEGGSPAEVSDLESTDLGMVFFDVVLPEYVAGTFSIGGQTRDLGVDTRGPSIAGITFDISNPYTQWTGAVFFGAPVDTDQTTFGNPDGDRYTNDMEWALVTNPLVPDEPAILMSEDNGDFVVTYYRRDPAVTGIDVFAIWAPSILTETWKLDGDGMTESSNGWDGDVESVSASVPVGEGDTSVFIRIQAEEQ